MATSVATDLNLLTRLQLSDHARFFKSWLQRIAPDTHQDQACGDYFSQLPWRLRRPRRT